MSYEVIRLDRLVFVPLREAPTRANVDALLAVLTAARHEAGRPLIYLALIPADAEPPTPEMRPVMASFARKVSRLCESVHLVIETEGFQGTILRSAITAVAMMTRERNLTVHRRLSDAIEAVQRRLGDPRAARLHERVKSYGSAA